MFKIICFGVRPHEVEIFHQFNTYDFELTLVESLLPQIISRWLMGIMPYYYAQIVMLQ